MTSAERSSRAYVLDASALLRYIDREPGFEHIAGRLKQASTGEVQLLISSVNWGEIASVLYKTHGLTVARATLSKLRALPLVLDPVNPSDAEAAAIFKYDFSVPYADAFAGSLALRERAVLITADFDFKPATDVLEIEFLPAKKGKKRP